MILKSRRSNLTREEILRRTTEYDIYRYYVGYSFPLNSIFKSPLREDRHPSFSIAFKGGSYFHNDFARPEYRGDCFDFVMQKFRIDFNEALLKIDQDMSLGIWSKPRAVKVHFEQPVNTAEKRPVTIQVEPKKFTEKELSYWASYYQGETELKAENVYSVGKVFLNGSRYVLGDNNMTFGYLYEDKYWKIYRPLIKGIGKWLSSVPIKLVDGLDSVVDCHSAIVTKSKKDKMCLKHLIPHVCSVQNESMAAFSDQTVSVLRAEAQDVYVAFDSDEVGVKASMEATKAFGFKHLNVPYDFLQEGIKDFAELMKVHGMREVQRFLQEKGVI